MLSCVLYIYIYKSHKESDTIEWPNELNWYIKLADISINGVYSQDFFLLIYLPFCVLHSSLHFCFSIWSLFFFFKLKFHSQKLFFRENLLLKHGKWKKVSCVWFLATPWTVAHQAPLFMGFSRQEYWSGLPFPSPEESSQPRDLTQISCIAGRFFTIWANTYYLNIFVVFLLKTVLFQLIFEEFLSNIESRYIFFMTLKMALCCFLISIISIKTQI